MIQFLWHFSVPLLPDTRLEDLFLSEQGAQIREHPAHWTLQDASKNLGISLATVRRKLTSGALTGYKISGQNGPEWRVIDPAQICEHPAQIREHPAQICEHPAQICEHPAQDVILDFQELDGPGMAEDQDEDQVPSTSQEQIMRELLAKVEALTYRNGYLEAQLEAERQQVKLLTDSRHKPSWLTKIANWFKGYR